MLFYEYFWLINFLLNIYNNYTKYYLIEIKEIDISNKNNIEIWIEYTKTQAFQRLYILLMKNKKINIISILKNLLILLIGIPIKLLNLLHFFLFKNNESFRTNLCNLYFNSYWSIKNCKIEILNKKIYLNCFTLGKLTKHILKNNSLITEKKFIEGMNMLKKQAVEFNKFEKENEQLKIIQALDENNKPLYKPHYGWYEKSTTAHATSNIPTNLRLTQYKDVPLSDLIKRGAKNPGTIITTEVNKTLILTKAKIVKKVDIESIKYSYPELFTQDKYFHGYIEAKHQTYENIVREYFLLAKNIDPLLIKELRTNNYSFVLITNDSTNFIEEYNAFYKTPHPL